MNTKDDNQKPREPSEIDNDEEAKVIAKGGVEKGNELLRREFLSLSATLTAAATLASCSPAATPTVPTSTPSPQIPEVEVPAGSSVTPRNGPGDQYQTLDLVFPAGTVFYVVAKDSTGNWYRVKTKKEKSTDVQQEGWVRVSEVKVRPQFEAVILTVPENPDLPLMPTLEVKNKTTVEEEKNKKDSKQEVKPGGGTSGGSEGSSGTGSGNETGSGKGSGTSGSGSESGSGKGSGTGSEGGSESNPPPDPPSPPSYSGGHYWFPN